MVKVKIVYLKFAITSLLMLLMASCGPLYTTEYEIIPPKTEMGSICANNCLLLKTNCESQCYRISYLELQNNQLQAVNRNGDGYYFNNYNSFNNNNGWCVNNCLANYYICHKNCGGEVITHTRCTAFCK